MALIPPKLKQGSLIRVVAPARTLGIISTETRALATRRFNEMGLRVSFGAHVEESDEFASSSVTSRIADLHHAFRDPEVEAIFTVIGGFSSNQLLRYIDFGLISANPKILCGYSDITALQNAIYAKAGLITYSGPHYSTLGMRDGLDYTLTYLKKCLFEGGPFQVDPSPHWSDDAWYLDQDARVFHENKGYEIVRRGEAEGTIIGGNLCTLNLLQGSEYMPSLRGSILFVEDDAMAGAGTDVEFDRNLQSLIHLPDFSEVRGLIIGRFQEGSRMDLRKIHAIISSKKELDAIPVMYGTDFGHTTPQFTFPVGGRVRIKAFDKPEITILEC